MDYVQPQDLINEARSAATRKAALSVGQLVLRGALAGGILAYATSLAMVVNAQGLPPIVAAICFPVGFVMLVLLGMELATGNFAVLPIGWLSGEVSTRALLRNWIWVYAGNLLGAVGYAVLFYWTATSFGATSGGALGDQLRHAAQAKTLGYMAGGAGGWGTALVKAVLCNWMVTLGTVFAMQSRSTIGKVVAMWLPIATFFAHGYEHSIVNMFVVPAGMLLGAPVSVANWWIWNQIPVTLGNIAGGVLLTGVALAVAYPKARAAGVEAASVPVLALDTATRAEPA